MSPASLALVLHAHLPFVRHPEYPEFLEEDWLFEAITETYLPLLQMLDRLRHEGVPFRLTLSLTPTLCSMLRDPLLQERYVRYLERATALAERELERTRDDAAQHGLAAFYHDRFANSRRLFVEVWKHDLVARFARCQEEGLIEIITSAATHGFLPLMSQFPTAVEAQIFVARDYHHECFGRDPSGIWLPECAYVVGIEKTLQEANIRWFILDSHGLIHGNPRPRYAIYAPCYTPAGPAVFARDRESSRQVWSAEEGYPGDPAYRDFYRDIGFDLPIDYLQPFLAGDGQRQFTGMKYHRISDGGEDKRLYRRDWAMGAADAHASHFMTSRMRQIGQLRSLTDIDPIIVCAFDAELFGHWWFEGPEFLELLIRKSVYDQQHYRLVTPSDYLTAYPTHQMIVPSASSWGHKGYWEVWLDESNSWIYPHLHAAARRMTDTARAVGEFPSPLTERAVRQMARELLLAQASDWAFLMKMGSARSYANKRTEDHILRFTRLYEQVRDERTDEEFLRNCEWRDNIFPNLNWRYYA